jgi:teichuronic acid exporter
MVIQVSNFLGMLERLKKSDFLNSIFILISGTVIAQIISYSLSPIITRLYLPEEMSYFSLLVRIVSFFAVIATARYEIAFPLPKRDDHAFSLYRSSFFITITIVLLSFILVLIIDLFDVLDSVLEPILYFIPFGILFVAFNSQGVNWAIRMKDFREISISKILQSSFNSVLGVVFGILSFGYLGLIYAFLIGVLVSNIPFFRVFHVAINKIGKFKLRGRNYVILKSYSDFPKINLPHVLMDLTKELFIAFYLISFFDKEVLGLYDFSFRMLRLPISLIGASISQVLFKNAADLINEKKSIYLLVRKTVLMLFLISIIPFGILFLFGEEIFSFIFGENWKEAGVYSEIMAPWLMINFILSPISQIPTVLNRQKMFFIVSLISTLVLIFSLVLNFFFPSLNLVFRDVLKIVSYGQFVCLSFLLFWIMKLIKKVEIT